VVFLLALLQFVLIAMIVKLMGRPGVSRVLSMFLLALAVIWYAAPVLIMAFFRESIMERLVVDYDQIMNYGVIETLAFILSIAFLFRAQPYFPRIASPQWALRTVSAPATVCILLCFIAVSFAGPFVQNASQDSYTKHNASSINAEATSDYNNAGSFELVGMLLTCFGYACLLHPWPRGFSAHLIRILVFGWTAAVSVAQLLSGSRFGIITPLLAFAVYARSQRWSMRKMVASIGLVTFLTIAIGGVALVEVGRARGEHTLSLQSTVLNSIRLSREQGFGSKFGASLLMEAVTKADRLSTGALLIRYDGYAAAGWQPYIGAFLALVPRQLLPSKPVPGSMDGTYRGHPGRVAAAAMGMDPASGNVQIGPAAITLWQFGYLGLIGLVLANALQFYVINSLLVSRSLWLTSLALFLVGIPTFLPLFTSPDMVIMNLQRTFVLYVVLFALVKTCVPNPKPMRRAA